MEKIVNTILMTVVYWIVIVPAGRILRKKLAEPSNNESSYFRKPDPLRDDHFTDPF